VKKATINFCPGFLQDFCAKTSSGGTFRFHHYQYETDADDQFVMIACTVIIQARFSIGT